MREELKRNGAAHHLVNFDRRIQVVAAVVGGQHTRKTNATITRIFRVSVMGNGLPWIPKICRIPKLRQEYHFGAFP